ncbi:PTS lactose/cellobiose transporter subunit IIA [Trichococcus shcherbakoviae]|uniref:Phosphotransferase system lactose/cellobiose-specific iia subunit n=1 Tax=Trichococcus shcherbakoviae TaxID=2094020 RepID=A0A383TDJ3_9LACT|nr:PTS lactose/cellobiose transporter subunit IIA [Trichococcus shcherbakoviae]SYZ78018.1 phosphotransferase system lactose/cellobiose-specific iia subunit [Trichococcus shcherbakoviae]
MAEPKSLDVIMQLIMHGGDAKGNAIEAIEAAKAGDFALANEKIGESEKALVEAHHAQTGLLTQEASGDAVELSLLMVHGQDHLMTSIAFKDLAKEIVEIYEKISK